MSDEELIAEAREFLVTPNLGKSLMRELDKAMIYIRRLADALEAVTCERDAALAAADAVVTEGLVEDALYKAFQDWDERANLFIVQARAVLALLREERDGDE